MRVTELLAELVALAVVIVMAVIAIDVATNLTTPPGTQLVASLLKIVAP